MSSQETYTLCPYCRERVDPDESGVVYACEIRDVPGFGEGHHYVDGLGGFFHPGCSPERVGYVRRPDPRKAA
jgi:hypothetical protein